MLTFLLLILIYFAFISLGLPDSLFGVAWPTIRLEWGLPLDYAGFVSIVIVCGTILSSLFSGKIIKWLGTGKVTFLSCLLTGSSIVGFSLAPSYIWLIILAFPLGFGAGSVDTALNNYVALHFKAHHMNWLHSFWGVGATVGPVIMASVLARGNTWKMGYRTVGSIQLVLAALLLISLPLWKWHEKTAPTHQNSDNSTQKSPSKNPLKIKGVKYSLATFVFYCSAEAGVGLWGSSFLVEAKQLPVELAASFIAMYYAGITIGRFISGFLSFKLNNIQMIRLGISIATLASFIFILPLPQGLIAIPLIFIGIGFAPIFPAMIHETPVRFGKENSQYIIGFQMASAYTGVALFAPGMGLILKNVSITLFPFLLILFILLVYSCSEIVIRMTHKKAII